MLDTFVKLPSSLMQSFSSCSKILSLSLQEQVIASLFDLSPSHMTPGLSPQTSEHKFTKWKRKKNISQVQEK